MRNINLYQMNRRQFIIIGTATAGIALASHQIFQRIKSDQFPVIKTNDSLDSQKLIVSKNGLLETTLEANYQTINLGGNNAYLLTYNRQIPGPRLEARLGDKVRIHFVNNLSQPTNLHYHGLHIPPTGKGDNVFLHIKPKEKITYEFDISPNQSPGIAWYHPHLHELTAEQVSGGLAGLFVIRGQLDEIPEIKAAKEEFLVLQDFALDDEGNLFPSNQMPLMMGREGNIITVNGQINPSFSISKNGLLRLRILNASSSRFYQLFLESHPFYLIANDGASLEKPVELSELLLTPGERVELLIKGDQIPGQYVLRSLPYNRGSMGMMGGMGRMMGNRSGHFSNNQKPIILATINYNSSVNLINLPTQLIPISSLPGPQKVRRFELNHGMFPGMGMAFLINGEPYQENYIQTQVTVNTVEDWELINTGVMDHPFHVHINKFQILSRNGIPEPYKTWKDTVLVRRGETVRIRIAFKDFIGKTAYHCHILDHEDLGMMGNLEIKSS
ncbi:multicopper oxidase family protein [Crocosphaera sp. UHCC 0190]|uniref:multicopper oxidase family protein n=1 Tax=Crocosphaera sp. UHCC 0190 TaxID=3110246 RepID=UPI002B1EC46D|nr:multicopper oxidase family protein [Crocosphaera sp. UHCC 0190]MEA5512132.1 multicopper oxidase family protein [Crocosphaera sp. UHCC 0190]